MTTQPTTTSEPTADEASADGQTDVAGGELSWRDVVEHSREVLAEKSRSFQLASMMLPPKRRDDASVLYALCRRIDDVADESTDRRRSRRRLGELEAQLAGRSVRTPLIGAFVAMAERRGIEVAWMQQLIEGVRSDVGVVRMETDRQLLRYCYRVAGTVGLMMSPILGVEDDRAAAHAVDLGVAMQLTNICRDVVEDAGRNRVYLPADRLRRVGLEPRAIVEGRFDPRAVAPVIGDLLGMADRYYESADVGMRYIPMASRLAIFAAARTYRHIGVRLRRRRCDVTAVDDASVLKRYGSLLEGFTAWLKTVAPEEPAPPHRGELHDALRGLPGSASQ